MNKEVIQNKFTIGCIEEYKRNNAFTEAWLLEHEHEYNDYYEALHACPKLPSPNLEKFWNSFPSNEHNTISQLLLKMNF